MKKSCWRKAHSLFSLKIMGIELVHPDNHKSSHALKGVSYSTYIIENWRSKEIAVIVHIFSRAVSYILPSGELFCVAFEETRNLPHGILVESSYDFQCFGLKPGMQVVKNRSQLLFGPGRLIIDLNEAISWNPYPEKVPLSNNIPQKIKFALDVSKKATSNEWHSILFEVFAKLVSGEKVNCNGDPILKRITVCTEMLSSAIQQKSPDLFLKTSKKLIGTGIGLTPSGDDILLGMIAALSLCDNKNSDKHWLEYSQQKLQKHLDSTTIVSKTFLQHAIQGRFPELLIDLIQNINSPENDKLSTSVTRLTHFGSSSGYEMALGVMVALSSIASRMP